MRHTVITMYCRTVDPVVGTHNMPQGQDELGECIYTYETCW